MKIIKTIFISSMLSMSIQTLLAQTNVYVAAFSKSYESEYKKDYQEAIKPLIENYNKQSYEENLRLGWLYYKAAKYTESLNYYQVAMDLMPAAIEAKAGSVYPIAAVNDFDKLIVQYNKILEIDPQDVNSNYQMGFYYYNKNNVDLAHKYFQKIVDLYPSGYETYLRAAWAKINNTKAPGDNVLAAFTKSYDLEYKKEYTGAIAALKEVYDKQYYDINLRLGWLYYEAKQYTESITYYQAAIDLKPNSIEPRLGYIYPAAALGNMDQVTTQYKKVLEINPQNTTANYQMGMISYNKKDYASAVKNFEKVVSLYPFDYDGLLMYAWTNYRINKPGDAKNLFDKVLMHTPGDKSALEGLSLIK